MKLLQLVPGEGVSRSVPEQPLKAQNIEKVSLVTQNISGEVVK